LHILEDIKHWMDSLTCTHS